MVVAIINCDGVQDIILLRANGPSGFSTKKGKKEYSMKRIFATGVLGLVLAGAIMAANVFKFTFSEVSYPDGRIGTIQASVKTTKNGNVTVVNYYSSPNDQYLGQLQGTDNASTDAIAVLQYSLDHFAERTPQN